MEEFEWHQSLISLQRFSDFGGIRITEDQKKQRPRLLAPEFWIR